MNGYLNEMLLQLFNTSMVRFVALIKQQIVVLGNKSLKALKTH